MAEQLPEQPVKQRGRPKRPQGAQRMRVLTLRVPEELLRRLDAYTGRGAGRPALPAVEPCRCAPNITGQGTSCYQLYTRRV